MLFLSFSPSIAIFLLHFQGRPLCFAFVSPLSVALMLQHPQEGFYDVCLNLDGKCFAFNLLVSDGEKSIIYIIYIYYYIILVNIIANIHYLSHYKQWLLS